MMSPETRGRLAVALVVCGLMFAFAGDGIGAYFTPDDMMNLYQAWSATPAGLLAQDRPVGQAVYRVLFSMAGLHPLPFRLAAFALLLANLALLYRFCARLAGSRETAALACLIGAYHAHLADLYYSTGAIYDLLCCFFVLWALVYYIGIRQAGRYANRRQQAAWLALYLCALGSKEMAVALPVDVLLYEALYSQKLREWLRRGAGFWWLSLALTVLYAAVKIAGPHAMTLNPDYAPHLSAHAFFAGWRHYLGDLFYGVIAFNTFKTVLLLAAMLALALYARRREMLFGWVMAVVGALPVIFIPPRGLFALYLTLPGWYLYAGSVLAWARDRLLRRLPRWAEAFGARPEQLALFVLLAVVLVPLHQHRKPLGKDWVAGSYQEVRSVLDPLDRLHPPRPGARVLFLSDPFDPGDWILTSMFRLHYRDRTLQVDRVKDHPELAAIAAQYDRVFVLDGRELREVHENTIPVLH
jgi:hypothetical protein